ncbi:MAG: sulfotransferase [Planctomycetes bacterium]|nr:sulfotransferase [Planctomycetota bacterium]
MPDRDPDAPAATDGDAPTYLFVLCPPYSGSTLLWNLVSTSEAVSALPTEGQFLPEVAELMRHEPWNRDRELPWPRIKAVWDAHWDHRKSVLVEKSPPNIIRTADIVAHFQPVAFLVMVRDPYAHCEGLMRRNGWSPELAAEFAVRCLEQQDRNARELAPALRITYEQLAGDPDATARRIEAFLPRLGRLDTGRRFRIHAVDGYVERGIEDLNATKIARLSTAERDAITTVLRRVPEAMRVWGYDYLEADR